ncbi:SCP2 sterol-binding domain-containing protein [Saccharothrix sp. S26]|uniref:SCP2 sterol-binding domain-containing protein n=1 Tax=Saccharothrix sp. S26 TaxID=2907215 RepID=UPI001F1AF1BF|nr:SCP2 sterol-binding domain-containing protein [Saccharothrix sp. S26]MCE6993950.1 SCP2 sterol-binding domain-containing protein [Saccharothrix sp. S26]
MTDQNTVAFHEIKQAITGLDADGVDAYAADRPGGAQALLDLVFANLPGAFLPERAGDQNISFQYVITSGGEIHRYHAVVSDGVCTAGRGDVESPNVTMTMDLAVFLQVLVGTMAPVRAFLTRKIKVSGEMMAATKFESWFARP